MIQSHDGTSKPWMVWWKEDIEASGYNKYVVLKMTHELIWRDADNVEHRQWANYSGPGTVAIQITTKSASNRAIYAENNTLNSFITPFNSTLVRDVYLELNYEGVNSAYVVTAVDVHSTPGVSYVTVDPSYIRDKSEEKIENPRSAADYWLSGGSN